MKTFDLDLAVVDHAGFGEPLTISATLFAPETPPDGPLELLACLHGATYTRYYWDARGAGDGGYSFAEAMVARGRLVLTLDALGMGRSSQPAREDRMSVAIGAGAHHEALTQVLADLAGGRFGPQFTGRPVRVTGVGHSMGGMLTIAQQAAFGGFDRTAILGWTNIGLTLSDETQAQLAADTVASGYVPGDRDMMRPFYHAPDVPAEVIAADDAQQSTTPASYGRSAIQPGVVAAEAAAIATPVFLHYAAVDVSPDPHREVACFRGSPSVTLTLLPGSAHCHNFAATRARSWDDLDRWISATPVA